MQLRRFELSDKIENWFKSSTWTVFATAAKIPKLQSTFSPLPKRYNWKWNPPAKHKRYWFQSSLFQWKLTTRALLNGDKRFIEFYNTRLLNSVIEYNILLPKRFGNPLVLYFSICGYGWLTLLTYLTYIEKSGVHLCIY